MNVQGQQVAAAVLQAIEGRLYAGAVATAAQLEHEARCAGLAHAGAARELVQRLTAMAEASGRVERLPGPPPRWIARRPRAATPPPAPAPPPAVAQGAKARAARVAKARAMHAARAKRRGAGPAGMARWRGLYSRNLEE
jgi:hypothetical protein